MESIWAIFVHLEDMGDPQGSNGTVTMDMDAFRKISNVSIASSGRSSTVSLISETELQMLINDIHQPPDYQCSTTEDIRVVSIHREFKESAVGIVLNGGSDHKNKEISVCSIVPGSIADTDGRIREGDKVLSINGSLTKNLTHQKAARLLKSRRKWFIFVISRSNGDNNSLPSPDWNGISNNKKNGILQQDSELQTIFETTDDEARLSKDTLKPSNVSKIVRTRTLEQQSIQEKKRDSKDLDDTMWSLITVTLVKQRIGFGFSLNGGKDSSMGDVPITINKIFTGGVAHQHGMLRAGDEIMSLNDVDFTSMSRLQAWNIMKSANPGPSNIVVKRLIGDAYDV